MGCSGTPKRKSLCSSQSVSQSVSPPVFPVLNVLTVCQLASMVYRQYSSASRGVVVYSMSGLWQSRLCTY